VNTPDERRSSDARFSVGHRWLFLCPHAGGRVCPIKQSQVGLHPIESQTRKGYAMAVLYALYSRCPVDFGPKGDSDRLQGIVGSGREPHIWMMN